MLGRRFASFVVLVLVLCMVGSAQAGAEVTHPFLSSFDGSETPAGALGQADGVAVDGASGDVYVADIANNVIDKFTAAGKYLCQVTGSSVPSASECDGITGSATAAGSFSLAEPAALAVDNSGGPNAGDLYVTDVGHGVVDRFSPSGEYLGEVGGSLSNLKGVGVDGAGNVWVDEFFGTVYEFDASGSQVFQFNAGDSLESGFAVDSSGDTYPHMSSRVGEFDSTGHELGHVQECSCVLALATDLSSDHVYVHVSGQSSVAEYSAARIKEGQFGLAQLGSGGRGGIAVDPVSETVYVANAADGKVYVFGPASGPRVTTGAATGVTTTGARLEGSVNPKGSDTTYQFEYGTTTGYGQVVPVPAADVGSGASPVPVSAVVTGLQGGTVYHYRLVASNADGSAGGADRVFTTLPVPVIDSASVTGLSESSAVLNARIDPRGLDTTYHFQWGTSTAYGDVAPVPDGDIGAGTSDVAVTQPIAGLEHDRTYHWRVVAKNANGTVVGVDHSFVYDTAGPGLPDNRAYEMVTPPRKNGSLIGDVALGNFGPQVSADGSRVFATTIQCFAGVGSCQAVRKRIGSQYAFTRTGGGWQAAALALPATQFDIDTGWNYSADLGTAILSAPAPGNQEEDLYGRRPDGSLIDIGPLRPPGANRTNVPHVTSSTRASADLSRFVWEQNNQEGAIWPFDLTVGDTSNSVYEYVGAGNSEPLLVGVSGGPGSRDLISTCGTSLGSNQGTPGDLSADGRTVYFTVHRCSSGANAARPVPAVAVYARVDESRTVAISGRPPGECTGACQASPPGDAQLYGASENGSKAFFGSTQQLTDTASEDNHGGDSADDTVSGCAATAGVNGCNLYEYDFSRPAGRELVDVSAGDSSGGGPRVRGVVAVAPDGSHVYFVAQGVLSGNANGAGQVAQEGADNLYVYERDALHPQGRLSFVVDLMQSDRENWSDGFGPLKTANVTPDGRYLVFASHARLTADDTSVSGAAQVFRYDAQTGELLRISVGEEGFNDNGNRPVATPCFGSFCSEEAGIAQPNFVSLSPVRTDPTMSHDGAYVFFRSPVALAPGALDDVRTGATSSTGLPVYAQNVYEWHAGHVYLISDGRDASNNAGRSGNCGSESSVCLLGADATGANVFFTTADRLVPADADTELDYYDARICTANDPCINPSVAPAGCLGEACRGASGSPPVFGAPASSVLSGAGNLAAAAKPAVKVKKKVKRRARPRKPRKARHKHARRAARTGRHVKRARG